MSRSETASRLPKLAVEMPSVVISPPSPAMMRYDSQESQISGSCASSPHPSFSGGEAVLAGERHRSALKIYLDILEAVRDKGPSKATKIIVMANLSHNRLMKHLSELRTRALLEERLDMDGKYYALTAKGLDFVNRVKEVEAFVAAFGLAL